MYVRSISMICSMAAVLLVASGLPASAIAQDRFEGTVRNSEVATPAALEWTIFARGDTASVGWLKISPPLGGSGIVYGFSRQRDSLLLVSVSQTGDTIVWTSPAKTGHIGGLYRITGGPWKGQFGSWQLAPGRSLSKWPLLLAVVMMTVLLIELLMTAAESHSQHWWAWRRKTPIRTLSDSERREYGHVSGWLAWFAITRCLVVAYLVVTIKSATDSLGSGTWMMGVIVPNLHPFLFMESVAHLLQLGGILVGLYLIYRSSPSAPVYWVLLLGTVAALCCIDLAGASYLLEQLGRQFPPDTVAEFRSSMGDGIYRNWGGLVGSFLWLLYWIHSVRVGVRFGPPPADAQISRADPAGHSETLASM
jgi:hypothetical protein